MLLPFLKFYSACFLVCSAYFDSLFFLYDSRLITGGAILVKLHFPRLLECRSIFILLKCFVSNLLLEYLCAMKRCAQCANQLSMRWNLDIDTQFFLERTNHARVLGNSSTHDHRLFNAKPAC